jgi:hypothetical protein
MDVALARQITPGPKTRIDDLRLLTDIIGVDSTDACREHFARRRGPS